MRHLAALATSACGPGVTGYEVVHETRTATTGAFTVANAKCSAGNSLLGGGYHTNNVSVHQSFPQTPGSGPPSWQVAASPPTPSAPSFSPSGLPHRLAAPTNIR
jgi:hypothetical protein